MSHGEFAVRGSIVDIFPMGAEQPLRLDLFDEDIDSIRSFDPETQRSGESLQSVRLLPAREYPITGRGHQGFPPPLPRAVRGRSGALAGVQTSNRRPGAAGIEYYLALFFERLETLFDYLPPQTLIVDAAGASSIAQRLGATSASAMSTAPRRRTAGAEAARNLPAAHELLRTVHAHL